MMDEGIDFRDDGQIVVRFDGETWTLRRPKFGHWRKYSRAFTDAATEAIAEHERLIAAVDAANEAGDDEALTAAEKALRTHNENAVIDDRTRILAGMFNELGDRALPAEIEEWPPWLILTAPTEPAVAAKILAHWRNVPKVSSSTPPG